MRQALNRGVLRGVTHQYLDYQRGKLLSPLAQLLPAQVLYGMLGINGGIIGGSPHFGHSL